jgi:tRNA-5-taurinomethyluridine 2-sulfurtransferase
MNIAVLVSGGVDSSVALRLLQQQGHTLTAFYLKIWLEDELSFLGNCPWEEDLSYVRAVCEQAGVPLEVISLQKEYHTEVVSYTIAEIKAGRTPNPDIFCNQRIKFGAFYKKIGESFDAIATGHYAQLRRQNNSILLEQAPDPIKDQTYFLSHLTQAQLAKALFPIGHLQKSEVRDLAVQLNIPNKYRKDSQGICFLGKLKFTEFIRYHVGDQEGDLIEWETGKKVGAHKGFWYYTIGQRQGLGLAGGPWYVVSKECKKNLVFVSKAYYSADKARDSFTVSSTNWITTEPPENMKLKIKLRHGPTFHQGTIIKISDDLYRVALDERDQGIAAGQFAVFYDNTICLGSGVINQMQEYDKPQK